MIRDRAFGTVRSCGCKRRLASRFAHRKFGDCLVAVSPYNFLGNRRPGSHCSLFILSSKKAIFWWTDKGSIGLFVNFISSCLGSCLVWEFANIGEERIVEGRSFVIVCDWQNGTSLASHYIYYSADNSLLSKCTRSSQPVRVRVCWHCTIEVTHVLYLLQPFYSMNLCQLSVGWSNASSQHSPYALESKYVCSLQRGTAILFIWLNLHWETSTIYASAQMNPKPLTSNRGLFRNEICPRILSLLLVSHWCPPKYKQLTRTIFDLEGWGLFQTNFTKISHNRAPYLIAKMKNTFCPLSVSLAQSVRLEGIPLRRGPWIPGTAFYSLMRRNRSRWSTLKGIRVTTFEKEVNGYDRIIATFIKHRLPFCPVKL